MRGFRIELGEIEAVLQRHPKVLAAVAKVIGTSPQDAYIAAYLVLAPSEAPSSEELTAYLGRFVPSYMLPSRWVPLAQMPLSANGKINRAALPDPEPASHNRSQAAPAALCSACWPSTGARFWAWPRSTRGSFFRTGRQLLRCGAPGDGPK